WFRDIFPRQSRTVGTKVHDGRVGREKVKKLQRETRKPESVEAGDFHPGQLGQ
ncbi:hypothetical protein KI387_017772, partial [Taxus chinensis]